MSGADIEQLRNGIIIDGIKTSPARIKVKKINKQKNTSIVEISIYEGRKHQVKKMFEALNYEVEKLKRERYAFLDLSGLRPGEYRR